MSWKPVWFFDCLFVGAIFIDTTNENVSWSFDIVLVEQSGHVLMICIRRYQALRCDTKTSRRSIRLRCPAACTDRDKVIPNIPSNQPQASSLHGLLLFLFLQPSVYLVANPFVKSIHFTLSPRQWNPWHYFKWKKGNKIGNRNGKILLQRVQKIPERIRKCEINTIGTVGRVAASAARITFYLGCSITVDGVAFRQWMGVSVGGFVQLCIYTILNGMVVGGGEGRVMVCGWLVRVGGFEETNRAAQCEIKLRTNLRKGTRKEETGTTQTGLQRDEKKEANKQTKRKNNRKAAAGVRCDVHAQVL